MGYYTRHELEIVRGDDNETDYQNDLTELTDYDCLFEDEIKWYDHESDLREFSKKHPKTLFRLSGEGGESGDLWNEYYKNGKMQLCKAKIVFDDYDFSKLR